jgi:hypothetical protein
MKKKPHKKKKKPVKDFNKKLHGFDIKINSFGEIQSNYDIDTVNLFLNKNLEDKKLKNKTGKEVGSENDENENKT